VVSRPGLILGYAGAIPGFTPLAPLRNYANTKWLSSALVRADEALVRPGPEAPSSARTRLWSGRTRLWFAPDQRLPRPPGRGSGPADEALVRPGPEAPSSARTRLWSGRTRLWSAPDQSSLVRPDLALVRADEATLLLLECGNKMVC